MRHKTKRPAFTHAEIEALIAAANRLERDDWNDIDEGNFVAFGYTDLFNARNKLIAVSNLFAE